MKKVRRIRWMLIALIVLLVVSILTPFLASAAGNNTGPNLSSDAAFLYNISDGQVLYDKNSDEKFPIYNLSMLMTTYLLFQDVKDGKVSLKDKATISQKSWESPSPKMFLEVGRKVTVKSLIEGLTVASGNDAAITTAEFLSGSTGKFVDRMNQEAKKLGMTNTTFSSPNGSSQDISTAKDLVVLAKALITDFPEYQHYFTQQDMKYATRPDKIVDLKNLNDFISDNPHATGLKSGWGDHQYHLVASVDKNGMKFIAVTLNASTPSKRATDIYNLLVYGYNQYQVINVARAGDKYADFSVYKSNTPGPSTVVYKDDLNAVVRVGVTADQLQLNYVGQGYIVGGSNKGTEVGKVEVYYQGKKLSDGPIVTTESFVKKGGFSAFLDSIALFFRNLIYHSSHSHH